jgi:hypothetical protein
VTLRRVEDNEWYPVWTLENYNPEYDSADTVREISPDLLERYTRIVAEWDALQQELDVLAASDAAVQP